MCARRADETLASVSSDVLSQSSGILAGLATVFDSYNDEEKKAQIKKVRVATV